MVHKISLDDCELMEAQGVFGGWNKVFVYLSFDDGSCLAAYEKFKDQTGDGMWMASTFDHLVRFEKFRPIREKKIVPLDSVDEIPAWCYGLWISNEDGNAVVIDGTGNKAVLAVDREAHTVYLSSRCCGEAEDIKMVSLDFLAKNRCKISAGSMLFKFYKEV